MSIPLASETLFQLKTTLPRHSSKTPAFGPMIDGAGGGWLSGGAIVVAAG